MKIKKIVGKSILVQTRHKMLAYKFFVSNVAHLALINEF